MFKAVCIDLDGTLLTDEKTIPKRSILMLDALIDRGIEVVIATGRHFFMANEFLKPLDRDIVVCTNNGAMTRYKDSGKLINIEYVDNVDFKNIFHSAIDFGINPFIYVDSFVDGFHLLVKDGTPKRSHFDEKHTNNKKK